MVTLTPRPTQPHHEAYQTWKYLWSTPKKKCSLRSWNPRSVHSDTMFQQTCDTSVYTLSYQMTKQFAYVLYIPSFNGPKYSWKVLFTEGQTEPLFFLKKSQIFQFYRFIIMKIFEPFHTLQPHLRFLKVYVKFPQIFQVKITIIFHVNCHNT